VKEGDKIEAFHVPDLVFHPDALFRRAAMEHLAYTAAVGAEWLMPGTSKTISVLTADVGSEDANASGESARAVSGALARDFLFALATFRQTRAAHMVEENNESLHQLLDPRTGVLGSIPSSLYDLPGEEWEAFRRSCARDVSLTAALDRFYERYGHLPLAGSKAVETIVEAWTQEHGVEGAWEAVWAWVGDESRPLRVYHAARVFLSNPDLVPGSRRAGIWSAVVELLGGFSGRETEATSLAQAWLLLQALARHYLQVLEVDAYDPDLTTLAALAWWAAERVTAEIVSALIAERGREEVPGFVEGVRVQTVERLARRSAAGWLLARPPRAPSAFAHATVSRYAVWRISLLEAGARHSLTVPAEYAPTILSLIGQALGAGFPPRIGSASDPDLAIDAPFGQIGLRWLLALPDLGLPRVAEADEHPDAAAEHAETVARIRGIVDAPDDERRLALLQLRSAVGLGLVGTQQLSWMLEDRTWWDGVFERLFDEELVTLTAILMELIRGGPEQWQLALPRLLRQQSVRDDLTPERRTIAARTVVQCAAICGHTMELSLLVRESNAPEVLDVFSSMRLRLSDILRLAPPLVQARLRTILSLLPPHSGNASE